MDPQNPQYNSANSQQPPNQQMQSMYPTMPSASSGLPIVEKKKDGPPLIFFILPIVVLLILLTWSVIFGLQAASERDDYKNNVQAKIDEAVDEAEAAQRKVLEAEFLEREKSPFRRYQTPAEFGSVRIDYPKTWAAYIDENGRGKTPLEGYMHPSFVPGERSGTSFALKIEVIEKPYDDELDDYQNEAKKGVVRISPYTATKVPSVLGARVDGEVEKGYKGSSVLFPLRDKTIKITTLSPSFVADFNNIILPNLVFTP